MWRNTGVQSVQSNRMHEHVALALRRAGGAYGVTRHARAARREGPELGHGSASMDASPLGVQGIMTVFSSSVRARLALSCGNAPAATRSAWPLSHAHTAATDFGPLPRAARPVEGCGENHSYLPLQSCRATQRDGLFVARSHGLAVVSSVPEAPVLRVELLKRASTPDAVALPSPASKRTLPPSASAAEKFTGQY